MQGNTGKCREMHGLESLGAPGVQELRGDALGVCWDAGAAGTLLAHQAFPESRGAGTLGSFGEV